jgi:hypothetical protein
MGSDYCKQIKRYGKDCFLNVGDITTSHAQSPFFG